MKKFKHFSLLLCGLFLICSLGGCSEAGSDYEDSHGDGEDEGLQEPEEMTPAIEKSLDLVIKADQLELSNFLPDTLDQWDASLDSFDPTLHYRDTWIRLNRPEFRPDDELPFKQEIRLSLGFNATGAPRDANFVIDGLDRKNDVRIIYHIHVTQQAETRKGKVLNLSLTQLMPVNFAFQVAAPGINLKQHPLELEFENGLRIQPLQCTEHIATIRIDTDAPFRSRMKVHVGKEVFDFGDTRIYKFEQPDPFYLSGMQQEQLSHVDLGRAMFQTCQRIGDERHYQYLDDRLETCHPVYYDDKGREMTDAAANFSVDRRLSPDVYFGEVCRYECLEDNSNWYLASMYGYDDFDKTLHRLETYRPKSQRVVLRRSTGMVNKYVETDTRYSLTNCCWVASNENDDEFYLDDETNGKITEIGSLRVSKHQVKDGDVRVVTLKGMETFFDFGKWLAVEDEILLTNKLLWRNRNINFFRPSPESYVEQYHQIFNVNKILCQWLQRDLIGPDGGGYGRYRTVLRVSAPVSKENCFSESWEDSHSAPVTREYKVYSDFKRTLFVPLIHADQRPDWRGYKMFSLLESEPFNVSGQLMDEYQDPDLEEIDCPGPFIGNYTYYYRKSSGELYRQQLEPLGQLERVCKVPSTPFYSQYNEDGLQLSYNEVTVNNAWVMWVPVKGQPVCHYLKPDADCESLWSDPL